MRWLPPKWRHLLRPGFKKTAETATLGPGVRGGLFVQTGYLWKAMRFRPKHRAGFPQSTASTHAAEG